MLDELRYRWKEARLERFARAPEKIQNFDIDAERAGKRVRELMKELREGENDARYQGKWSIKQADLALRLIVAGAAEVEPQDLSDLIQEVLGEEGWREGSRYQMIRVALAYPELSPQHLEQLLEIVIRDSQDTEEPRESMMVDVPEEEEELLLAWLNHPNTNRRLTRKMVEHALRQPRGHPTWGRRIRTAIFEQDDLRMHPGWKDLLAEHAASPKEFGQLFADRNAEETRKLFREQMARRRPAEALLALEENRWNLQEHLQREDLSPLLAATNVDREMLMRRLAKIELTHQQKKDPPELSSQAGQTGQDEKSAQQTTSLWRRLQQRLESLSSSPQKDKHEPQSRSR